MARRSSGSCAFLTGMLAATAACVFPVMLRSIDPGVPSLTAYNSSVPAASLETAFTWWIVGFPLALIYFAVLFRLHRGKAVAARAARVLAAERTEESPRSRGEHGEIPGRCPGCPLLCHTRARAASRARGLQ
jgi:hypothetical protein